MLHITKLKRCNTTLWLYSDPLTLKVLSFIVYKLIGMVAYVLVETSNCILCMCTYKSKSIPH